MLSPGVSEPSIAQRKQRFLIAPCRVTCQGDGAEVSRRHGSPKPNARGNARDMVKGRTQRSERIFHEFATHNEVDRWSANTARHGPVRSKCEHSLSGYSPPDSVKRLVRTRMLGVVGAEGERPPATRLDKLTGISCHKTKR
jgi:hypothetical protein